MPSTFPLSPCEHTNWAGGRIPARPGSDRALAVWVMEAIRVDRGRCHRFTEEPTSAFVPRRGKTESAMEWRRGIPVRSGRERTRARPGASVGEGGPIKTNARLGAHNKKGAILRARNHRSEINRQNFLVPYPIEKCPQLSRSRGVPQLAQRFRLDLTYALASHCEGLADFF